MLSLLYVNLKLLQIINNNPNILSLIKVTFFPICFFKSKTLKFKVETLWASNPWAYLQKRLIFFLMCVWTGFTAKGRLFHQGWNTQLMWLRLKEDWEWTRLIMALRLDVKWSALPAPSLKLPQLGFLSSVRIQGNEYQFYMFDFVKVLLYFWFIFCFCEFDWCIVDEWPISQSGLF